MDFAHKLDYTTPGKGARQYVINDNGTPVTVVIDVYPTVTEIMFGILELWGDGSHAQWMGPNANQAGGPMWKFERKASPVGGGGSDYGSPVTHETMFGNFEDIVNHFQTTMLSDYKGQFNTALKARFPAASGGTAPVVPTVGSLANEGDAIAWLMSQISTVYGPLVNGQIP